MPTYNVSPGETVTVPGSTPDDPSVPADGSYTFNGLNDGSSGSPTIVFDGSDVLINGIFGNGLAFVIILENGANVHFDAAHPGIQGQNMEIHINGDSTLDLTNAAGGSNLDGRTIYFGTGEDDGNGSLLLPDSQFGPHVNVEGFSPGDRIDYGGTPVSITYTVTENGVDVTAHYDDGGAHNDQTVSIIGDYDPDQFQLDPDGNLIYTCFLAGTLIRTPSGSVPVEELKPGDLVLTHDGKAKPVRWLARQTVAALFADPLQVLPIRIMAGALDENLPERDLFVSPDHALLVDRVLVQAGALVNGTTITRYSGVPNRFVYYHVELADHSLILAEGVPAETFIDNVARQAFDNWAEHPLGADPDPIPEMDRPRAKAARQLPARIHERLAEREQRILAGARKAA